MLGARPSAERTYSSRLRRRLRSGSSAPSVPVPTIVPPAVRYLVASALSGSSPVTLADLCSARYKQSENFGRQRVVGITVGCSTLELMAHCDLGQSTDKSYACDVVGPVPRRARRGRKNQRPFWRFCRCHAAACRTSANVYF
jgi:hypothetical protein